MADAISIEQNNKIRAALGLKPLPVPGGGSGAGNGDDGPIFKSSRDDGESSSEDDDDVGSTLEKREAMAGENWAKLQEEQAAKKRREERAEAIRRAREAAQRNTKLEGKSLGEVDMEMDTKTWLSQAKKKQKEIEKERARKLAEELEERERERAIEYTSKDLSGVRVAHELDEFGDEVGEQVLTLKDTTIDEDEEEGVELENVHLREREKTKERLENKKRKLPYDPNADGSGSILAQYDDEIEGKKRKRFTLDSKDIAVGSTENKQQDISSKLKSQAFNLDDVLEPVTTSDYQEPTEIKIKKPKKKKTKSTRRRRSDDDDIEPVQADAQHDQMDIDSGPVPAPVSKKIEEDLNFDNEDLAASLALQRRAALKKRKKLTPEEIARQLKEEAMEVGNQMDTDDQDADGDPGIVLDETSEFVANLQNAVEERQRSVSHPPRETPVAESNQATVEDEDVHMETSEAIPEHEVKQEESEEAAPKNISSSTGLAEESELDQGLGSTLAMLKQRGLVKESNASELNSLYRDRQRFLQEKHRLETEAEQRARLQRERDRTSGRLERLSGREREDYARQENKARDQIESRQLAEIFNREYKPDVQLKYVDEHGRLMDQKEAFKHLSHQFHGKGSGKMKTEKHLKKIQDEKKREAMSTLDSSQHTGMNNAMGVTAKKNRQAGVRLG
ncbi:DNA binding protein SART-1 [Ascosphaera apis ARSEF 7405]|uniref:DNA binding protein SART-1 n=1 Tax=Ascosphaera apis ARSEF 7405 TaxID=392613 RepID=A0A167YWS3_9EURO|nr:DNA binding protein SART-1 [Ascosphaera apis ARSEF 7405]